MKVFKLRLLFISLLLLLLLLVNSTLADYKCAQTSTTNGSQDGTSKPIVDFLFIVDVSPSMTSLINGVKSGLADFVKSIANSEVDATFGLVSFGGVPGVRSPFVVSHSF